MNNEPLKIKKPKDVTLIELKSDPNMKGNKFYATFDEDGEYVKLQFKNNKEITFNESLNEAKLKDMGFTIKNAEITEYLKDKGLRIYKKCGCLIKIDTFIETNQCKPELCIKPKKTKYLNKSYI